MLVSVVVSQRSAANQEARSKFPGEVFHPFLSGISPLTHGSSEEEQKGSITHAIQQDFVETKRQGFLKNVELTWYWPYHQCEKTPEVTGPGESRQ